MTKYKMRASVALKVMDSNVYLAREDIIASYEKELGNQQNALDKAKEELDGKKDSTKITNILKRIEEHQRKVQLKQGILDELYEIPTTEWKKIHDKIKSKNWEWEFVEEER